MNIEKISFYAADSEELSLALDSLPPDAREVAREVIRYYSLIDSEAEFKFAPIGEALSVRVFDYGRYSFIFPIPLSDGADILSAVEKTVVYSYLEELEPVFLSVPSEDIGVFSLLGYRHFDVDAASPDGAEYRVTLKNELSLADGISEATGGRISLSPITEADSRPYAKLCRDEKTNEFMGYDWREDYPDADDTLFVDICKREFEYCSALTLAVRLDGRLVGDAALHNFDYKGGADISLRILPEYRRRGYAKEALSLLLDISREIGLVRLYARVDNRNTPSLSLFSEKADQTEKQADVSVFVYQIL